MSQPTTGNVPIDRLIDNLANAKAIYQVERSLMLFIKDIGVPHAFFHAGALSAPGTRRIQTYTKPPLCITSLPSGWETAYSKERLNKVDTVLQNAFRGTVRENTKDPTQHLDAKFYAANVLQSVNAFDRRILNANRFIKCRSRLKWL